MKNRASLYSYADGSKFKGKIGAEIFKEIYQNASWNLTHQESVSGEGSDRIQTATLIKQLPRLLQELGVKTILDIPCGDFFWMQQVALEDIKYWGGDIVPELITHNQQQYGSAEREFMLLDLMHDALPKADLIFCRDCLVHLSLADIQLALENIKRTEATWLLTTHFPEEAANKDIDTGGWRPLNFCLPPFDFSPPKLLINEGCSEMNGAFRDKSVALWNVAQIK
jgi:hypothetical protein